MTLITHELCNQNDSSCAVTWPAGRSGRGPGRGSQTLFGWAEGEPTRGSAPSAVQGPSAAECRTPGTEAAPRRLRGRWWAGGR